jgi:hypothetical protein
VIPSEGKIWRAGATLQLPLERKESGGVKNGAQNAENFVKMRSWTVGRGGVNQAHIDYDAALAVLHHNLAAAI